MRPDYGLWNFELRKVKAGIQHTSTCTYLLGSITCLGRAATLVNALMTRGSVAQAAAGTTS